MPPSRTSESPNVVVFTYKRRKVACARPATYEDALYIAKKTFVALKAIPAGRICIAARLPDHEQAGFVEIAPEAWKLATKGVNQFAIGILDEEDVQEAEEVKKENVQERALRPFTPPPPKRSKAPRTSGASSGSSKKAFWIIVRTMTGRSIHITDLHRSDDVSTLKAKVQDETGICPKQQRLIVGGNTLEDDRTLAYHSIKSGDVLWLILNLQGGKPVIYLYPPTSINAKIRLSLVSQWSLSAVYPRAINGSFKEGKSSQTAEWEVVAHPSGMMAVEGSSTEVAYIFWEAETESQNDLPDSPPMSRSSSPPLEARHETLRPRVGFVPGATRCSPHNSVVLSVQDVPPYLEKALLALGLHTEARTSFITYWLPSFLKHEHLALRFVPQVDYEASAPLDIEPKPDVVTRVFMLFEGIPTDGLDDWDEARERSLEDVNMWKGIVGVDDARQSDQNFFRVLEWGGMEFR